MTIDAPVQDLQGKITKWKDTDGDQIILIMDLNEDTRSTHTRRWLRNCGLHNIFEVSSNCTIPATQQRGTFPIDGIFVSNTIHPLRKGFLPFGEFPSNHRAIWADISFDNAFGHKIPKIIILQARRLKCDDPTVRNQWVKFYTKFIK